MVAQIRVLLIEDDEDDYVLTRDLLAEAGGDRYQLEWAASYEAAREGMRQNVYDVYLLDYRLDSRTGLELLREARQAGCTGPVILLTGQGDRALDLEAMQAGVADFLVKGRIDPPMLERSIRYALERQRAAEALHQAHAQLEAQAEALRRAHDELEAKVAERTRELSEANAQLAEADRRKNQFLAMLAHELRNPLAPVRNALYILKQPHADLVLQGRAKDMIERQVCHMTRLIDDLLDVSRIMRGKIELRKERLDLVRLVRTTTEDYRSGYERAGIKLVADLPDVPLWVSGDATRLTQVLDNLLDNALKFTPRGGQVEVRLVLSDDRGQAVLTVRDNGVGIEPVVLSQVFEVFAQADRSLERTQGGLGLGLSLVKGLVDLHGGEVSAASAGPGLGAEFTVRLPARSPTSEVTTPPTAPRRAGKHLRILVVEDNRDAADSLRMLLELSGYEVTVAYSGPAGLQAAQEWRPDVVLCDIGLPGMNGFDVASRLRQSAVTSRARLIAVTGYGQEEDLRKAREAGFDLHLIKPVNPEALCRALNPVEEEGR